MASQLIASPAEHRERRGLADWASRVLAECDRVQQDFDAKSVHDLRIALRRCRSIARTMIDIDSYPAWGKLNKTSRKLFKRLGDLRDTHIQIAWVQKLGPEGDPLRTRLLETLAAREQEAKSKTRQAFENFDRKLWHRRAIELAGRARRVPADGLAFQHLALERWNQAVALHGFALRSRSRVAFHRLRIGIKRFRYTAENFLPRRHATWGPDLKRIQDLLGDVHDLDVMRRTLRLVRPALDRTSLASWFERIERARRERLEEYHRKTTGKDSLWLAWRRHLPSGKRLELAALAKLEAWASFLDPDFRHARQVAGLSLQLFDSLPAAASDGLFQDAGARRILYAAALLHDVGRSKGKREHHKSSYRLIRDCPPPLGWTRDGMQRVALVARYHRGAEPRSSHEGYGSLSPREQQKVAWLAAVLRLADSLDADRSGKITRLDVENRREALVVRVAGCGEEAIHSAVVAEKKRLLERCIGRPVIVQSSAPDPAVAA